MVGTGAPPGGGSESGVHFWTSIPLEDVISVKSQYQIKKYLYVFLLETEGILIIIDFCINYDLIL
jgi:hypothetical protein